MSNKEPAFFRRTGGVSVCIAIVSLFLAQSVLGEIIPADRRIDWTTCGTPIPSANWTVFTNLASSGVPNNNTGDAAPYIQQAINACPPGQVVYIPPGTYHLLSGLTVSKGIVLRGAGYNTILMASTGDKAVRFLKDETQYPNSFADLTDGYVKGSTTLTLNASQMNANLKVGGIVLIDQVNDGTLVNANGTEGLCTYCSRQSGNRALAQRNRVTAINGSTVTLETPLYWTLQSTLAPQIGWYSTAFLTNAGLEDIAVDYSGGGNQYIIEFGNTANCWARNVKASYGPRGFFQIYGCYRCTFQHNYMTLANAGSQSYGFEIHNASSHNVIQDNIGYTVAAGIVFGWQSMGNVIAYNYFTNTLSSPQTYLGNVISIHDAHCMFNLLEGNNTPQIYMDFIHGSASHQTLFRNRIYGWEANGPTSANAYCIIGQSKNVYGNFVGNVLGVSGISSAYMVTANACSGNEFGIFKFGFNGSGCNTTSYDNNVLGTALIHGNYDFKNKSILYDSTITDHAIPASLYLASKPTWFGDRPFPPYDPGSPGAASVDPLNLPAAYRFVFGTDPPTGGPANLPPVGVVLANPTSGVSPLLVTFSSLGSLDPEGVALSYSWAFGDGGTSTAANPTHTYQSDGVYVPTLTISDGVNLPVSVSTTVKVGNQPPVAVAGANPRSGAPPLSVAFSSVGSSDPEGVALSYNWTFGDGATSTTANPTHVYQTAGTYLAKLTVSDGVKTGVSSALSIGVRDPASALVAAYSFDEGSGSTVTDLSGNGNVGTITGATWTKGRTNFGNALAFNGSGALVTINDSASLHLTNGMTLEAWVYPTALGSRWTDVIYKAADVYFLMGTTPQNQSPDLGGTFASANIYYLSALPLNTWSHLAGTYDGATMNFYLNGIRWAGSTRAQTGPIAVSSGPLSIGGDPGNGQYWTGLIDEVRIYNRALSQFEIQRDRNTPLSVSTPRVSTNAPPRVVSN